MVAEAKKIDALHRLGATTSWGDYDLFEKLPGNKLNTGRTPRTGDTATVMGREYACEIKFQSDNYGYVQMRARWTRTKK